MEHELFYSKLRPSVESSSLVEVIRGSSSGENSHRAAALELFFERSVQEYREGVAAGAKEPKTHPLPPDPPATGKKPGAVEPMQGRFKGSQPRSPATGPGTGLGSLWLALGGDFDPTDKTPRPTRDTRPSMPSAKSPSS